MGRVANANADVGVHPDIDSGNVARSGDGGDGDGNGNGGAGETPGEIRGGEYIIPHLVDVTARTGDAAAAPCALDPALARLAAEFGIVAGTKIVWDADGNSFRITGTFRDEDLDGVTWVTGVVERSIIVQDGKFGAHDAGGRTRHFKYGSKSIAEAFNGTLGRKQRKAKKDAVEKGNSYAVLGLPKLSKAANADLLAAFGEILAEGQRVVATSLTFRSTDGVGCDVPAGVGCQPYAATAAIAPKKHSGGLASAPSAAAEKFASELRGYFGAAAGVEVKGQYVWIIATGDEGIDEQTFNGFSIPQKLDTLLPDILSIYAGTLDRQGRYQSLGRPLAAAEVIDHRTKLRYARKVKEVVVSAGSFVNADFARLRTLDRVFPSLGLVKYVKTAVYWVPDEYVWFGATGPDNGVGSGGLIQKDRSLALAPHWASDDTHVGYSFALGNAVEQILAKLGDSVTATPLDGGIGVKFVCKVSLADWADLTWVRTLDALPLTLSDLQVRYTRQDSRERALDAGSKSLTAILGHRFREDQRRESTKVVKIGASYVFHSLPRISPGDVAKIASLFEGNDVVVSGVWVESFTLRGGTSGYTRPDIKGEAPTKDAQVFAGKLREALNGKGAKVTALGGGKIGFEFESAVLAKELNGLDIISSVENTIPVTISLKAGATNHFNALKAGKAILIPDDPLYPIPLNNIATELANFRSGKKTLDKRNAAVAGGNGYYQMTLWESLGQAYADAAKLLGTITRDTYNNANLGGESDVNPDNVLLLGGEICVKGEGAYYCNST